MSMSSASTVLYVAAQPTRREIIHLLREQGPLPLAEIADRLELPEEITGFHLVALEQHGLIKGTFKLATSQPKAVRYFEVTDSVGEALSAACDQLM